MQGWRHTPIDLSSVMNRPPAAMLAKATLVPLIVEPARVRRRQICQRSAARGVESRGAGARTPKASRNKDRVTRPCARLTNGATWSVSSSGLDLAAGFSRGRTNSTPCTARLNHDSTGRKRPCSGDAAIGVGGDTVTGLSLHGTFRCTRIACSFSQGFRCRPQLSASNAPIRAATIRLPGLSPSVLET